MTAQGPLYSPGYRFGARLSRLRVLRAIALYRTCRNLNWPRRKAWIVAKDVLR